MDNVLERLTNAALLRSSVQWQDCADRLDFVAAKSFDIDNIRLWRAERDLCEAAARWRQVYAEVTA